MAGWGGVEGGGRGGRRGRGGEAGAGSAPRRTPRSGPGARPRPAGWAARPARTAAAAASTARRGGRRVSVPGGGGGGGGLGGGWGGGGSHHILQQDSLAQNRPVVDARAPVAVPARAHLKVEGAVDLVLLRAEDLGQMLRHLSQVLLAGRRRPVSVRAHKHGRGVRRPLGLTDKLRLHARGCVSSVIAWDRELRGSQAGLVARRRGTAMPAGGKGVANVQGRQRSRRASRR
jgi:hypothetical protein